MTLSHIPHYARFSSRPSATDKSLPALPVADAYAALYVAMVAVHARAVAREAQVARHRHDKK
jgi:hypothetical protein